MYSSSKWRNNNLLQKKLGSDYVVINDSKTTIGNVYGLRDVLEICLFG
jgi:hypothetical protein